MLPLRKLCPLTGLLAAAALQLAACSGSVAPNSADTEQAADTGRAEPVALNISDARSGQHFACVPLSQRSFELSFIHSVSLTPVRDIYRIPATDHRSDSRQTPRIMQTAEHFIAHGQGLPSMEGEPDATAFEHKNGEFILQMQRPIHDLIVRTDHRFKNRLHSGTTTVNLNQWPNTGLRITPVNHCD